MPVYEYSLKQGIDDGFLAPYRITRAVLSPDAYGWQSDQGQLDLFGARDPAGPLGDAAFERVVSLLSRTEVAAKHLTEYLNDRPHGEDDPLLRRLRARQPDARGAPPCERGPDAPVPAVRRADRLRAGRRRERAHFGDVGDVESETPVIATTSKLLSTGVDLPTVKNIVLFKADRLDCPVQARSSGEAHV
jgi:type I restriction enzyme, R subunit